MQKTVNYFFIVLLVTWLNMFAQNQKMNIVLIVSDDHGTNDLGCYGNEKIQTPNLDKLADEGIRFTNAYATSASCTASRSVILTGIYNHANGLYGHAHHFHHFKAFEHIKSLPVLLSELADYRTASVGKYHVAPESVFHFQNYIKGDQRNPFEMSVNSEGFIAEDSDKPFFLYFCTGDPHRGFGVVEEDPLKPNKFGNKSEGYDGIEAIKFSLKDVIVPEYLPDLPETRAELAQYYESVARMDQGIGKLFEILKRLNKWNNTVVIYISDNGIAFPGAKTNVYEPGVKLPCIVKYPPKTSELKVANEFINWADLTPTILDIAGVLPEAEKVLMSNYLKSKDRWDNTANQKFQGKSFKSVLEGNSVGDWNETYASHTFHEITMYYPMRVVISGNIKLIWNIASKLPYPHASDLWESSTWQAAIKSETKTYAGKKIKDYTFRPEFELFDLNEDPNELNNLAYRSDKNDLLEDLKTKLKRFMERTNDPWSVKWHHE